MESRANDGVYQVGHSSLKATVAADTNRGSLSSVRLARIDDLQKLGAVERSAASLFRAVGLGWVADGTPVERAALAAMHKNGTLWWRSIGRSLWVFWQLTPWMGNSILPRYPWLAHISGKDWVAH